MASAIDDHGYGAVVLQVDKHLGLEASGFDGDVEGAGGEDELIEENAGFFGRGGGAE